MSVRPTANAGPLEFALEHRFGRAGGWTIHVFGPRLGKREEILRFDCFDVNPHFHLGWSYTDRMFVPIPGRADPLAWSIAELRAHLPDLLRESGVPELIAAIEAQALGAALDAIEAQARLKPAA